MKIYALFLDIDNTLYYNGKVPKRNVDALAEARKLGHFIFLNTARSMGFIPKEMFDEVPLDGAVAGIGTDLRFRGKQIFHNLMSQDECFEIAKYFEVIGGDMREAGRDNKAKVIDYVLETMEATKDDVIMVGDRKFDINGAHAIGIPCIAVEWGYGDRAEFEAHGADHIAATTEEVANLF